MIIPNLNIAPNSERELVEIAYDAAGKYYVLTKTSAIVQDGVHIEASKRLMLTIEQAEKLRDDLVTFFGIHKKYVTGE